MANSNEIAELRRKLGVASGARVTAGLSIAFDYFKQVLRVDPLAPHHTEYLRGIDFHRPVTIEPLTVGLSFVRFPEIIGGVVQPEKLKPYRFFAAPGATPLHLGWNPEETGFQLYQLRQPVDALVSFANAIRFRDSRSRLGGNRQIVVPWDTNMALIRERDYDRQKLADLRSFGYLPLGLP